MLTLEHCFDGKKISKQPLLVHFFSVGGKHAQGVPIAYSLAYKYIFLIC